MDELVLILDTPGSAVIDDNDVITGIDSGATAAINVGGGAIEDEDLGGGEGIILAKDDNGATGEVFILNRPATDQDATMNQADDTAAVWTASATDDIDITIKSSPIIHGGAGEIFEGINRVSCSRPRWAQETLLQPSRTVTIFSTIRRMPPSPAGQPSPIQRVSKNSISTARGPPVRSIIRNGPRVRKRSTTAMREPSGSPSDPTSLMRLEARRPVRTS